MKKRKNISSIVFILVLIGSVYSLFFMFQEENDLEKNFFSVIDITNLGEESLSELFNEEDFFERLILFNQDIRNQEDFIFTAYNSNVVELIGEWDKPLELANGYGYIDTVNQEVKINNKDLIITPVDSLRFDKEALEIFPLSLAEGQTFQEDDFILNEYTIPLILGDGFSDYYSVGDEIPLLYLCEEFTGIVKGILKEGEIIEQDFTEYYLDNKILVPSFDFFGDSIDSEFQKFACYVQTEGYVLLEDKSDYKQAKKIVKKLASKYDLPYELLKGY